MGSKFETRLLGELCHEITVGFVGTMTNEYIENGIPFLRSKNIEEYDVKWDDMKYVSSAFHKKLSKSVLKPGDVAIVRTGKPGTTCVIPNDLREANCSDIVIARVNNELLCPHYLSYFMNAMAHGQVNAHIVGAVQQHFNVSSAKKLEIPLPSRVKQTKIVQVLKTLDDKLKLNRQINQTLEQMAQTLFKSWFVDFDPVVDNALDAGFFEQDLGFSEELLHRVEVRKAVRESDNFKPLSEDIRRLFPNAFEECVESALGLGGWMPKEWVYKAAENIANVSIGKTPPRKESEWFSEQKESNITWVSIRDMGEFGTYTGSSREYLTANAVKKFNIKLVPKGSILLSFKLTLGRVAIASEELTTNEAIAHFVEPKHDISASYLYCYLTSFDFNSLGSTSSIATAVNSKIIKNMPILVPTKSILNCFKTKVEPLFRKMKLIDDEIVTLTKLRDTLLPKLISGELSLSDIKTDITEEILI
ncbi:restriction endonuclease subunit S [Proteus mirabilis]|uniref:restriction endonuclease subunit S n=1 Tax=Proteus mirabilis TaxID=584 RepID=UPI001A1969AD|nr:restriction endonuclease subunit S [Proteus mirabilis]MBI6244993.1 restriction endonuclease subunit S [Proteus mirabilis]MCW9728323.1 restriction endonuclease subunit S [Proteus mirabilis]